jgi:hypothetical protein
MAAMYFEKSRMTAALQHCASAARQQRSVVVTTQGNGSKHVLLVARNYDTDRHLAVVRSVGCVKGAATRVKANFSAKVAAKGSLERGGVELRRISWG